MKRLNAKIGFFLVALAIGVVILGGVRINTLLQDVQTTLPLHRIDETQKLNAAVQHLTELNAELERVRTEHSPAAINSLIFTFDTAYTIISTLQLEHFQAGAEDDKLHAIISELQNILNDLDDALTEQGSLVLQDTLHIQIRLDNLTPQLHDFLQEYNQGSLVVLAEQTHELQRVRKAAGWMVLCIVITLAGMGGLLVIQYGTMKQLRRTEQHAQQAKAEAEKANAEKSNFLSSVSHELRTPLSAIVGFSAMIEEKLLWSVFPQINVEDDPKNKKIIKTITRDVGIIVKESERLTALINDILDVSKIEAGALEYIMTPTEFCAIVEHAAATTSPLLEGKDVAVKIDCPNNLPLITLDNQRILQVLINLFANAAKFTVKGEITCTVTHLNDTLQVLVSDTGVGIAPEHQAHIFDKFKQGGDPLRGKPQGTGLGLTICRNIIEHHQGRIWVKSTLGEGSTFGFSIPTAET